jgi:uncharacterized protein (TIGR02466 family)
MGGCVSKSKKKVAIAPVKNTEMQVAYHFPTAIYIIDMPDFLPAVNVVSEEYLSAARSKHELDEIYPVRMTNSFYDDERVKEFSEFIGQMAWNILNKQGYAMQNFNVTFMEMWTQEHFKHSAMDAHVHGFGSQIVGFYFLETPEGGSNVVFHDPRAAKVQIDLPEQDVNMATPASKAINFTPKPGMMIFANSWLAHSFTRHAAELPIKFVHFNLTVIPAPQSCPAPAAEII